MKKIYLYLSIVCANFSITSAMIENDCWHKQLNDEIISHAKAEGHIKVDMVNSTFHLLSETDTGVDFRGVELTSRAFKEKNYPLFHYLLQSKIPLLNSYDALINLAIKKNSPEILELFHYYGLLRNGLEHQGENWLLKAIKKGNVDTVKFFLEKYKVRADKSNPKFSKAAYNHDIVELLKSNAFVLMPDVTIYESAHPSIKKTSYTHRDLFDSIKKNNVENVKKILKPGFTFNINKQDEEGETAVTLAVTLNCDLAMFDCLARCGANLEGTNINGDTPLVIASRLGNELIVNKLIDSGVYVNVESIGTNGEMRTALIEAVEFGHAAVVQRMIEHAETNLNYKDKNFFTPLMHAFIMNNFEIAQLLLKRASKENKALALRLLIKLDQIDLIKFLLKFDADPNYIYHNESALEYAARQKNNYESVKILLESGISEENKSFSLRMAIAEKPYQYETIKLLLDYGAEPNTVFENGASLLMYASAMGYIKIIEMLIFHGADPYLTDGLKRSPLMVAAEKRNAHSIAQLFMAEAEKMDILENLFVTLVNPEINSQDIRGNSALHYASYSSSPPCIKILLLYGSKPHLINRKQDTALSALAKLNEKDIFNNIIITCIKYISDSKNFTSETKSDNANFKDERLLHEDSLEKGKEKELEEYPLLPSISEIEGIESEKHRRYTCYFTLFEAFLAADKDIENPLQQLSEILDNNYQQAEKSEERDTFLQVGSLLQELIEQELTNIKECCTLIVKHDPKTINYIDNNKLSIFMHAVTNNNLAAVQALVPYASTKQKTATLSWMQKNNISNKKIEEELLRPKTSIKNKCVIS